MKSIFLILFFALICESNLVQAATYYVSPNGSDSNSCLASQSSSTPKRTIHAALACIGTAVGAGSGHVVEVAGGNYDESLSNVIPTGTSWNSPFTLRAQAGQIVTIKPSSGTVIQIDQGGAQYSIIQGFVIDGSTVGAGSGVVQLSGSISHVRLLRNEIKNAVVCGAFGTGLSNSLIYMGIIHHIEILENRIHDCECGHAMYVEGNYNLVKRNEIYNINRYAIQNYSSIPGNYPSNNIYDSNWVHDTGRLDTVISFAIALYTGTNNIATNNLVTNNQEGIGLDPGNYAWNNTLYGNGVGHGGECCYEAIFNVGSDVRNNILYGNAINGIYNSGGTTGYNLFSNPAFVDAPSGNFHLLAGSPAIDTGQTLTTVKTDFDGVPRPQGNGYDIGAYEYGGSTPSPTPTPPSTPPPTSSPTNSNYLGCFTDDANRALPVELASSGATVESCKAAAKGAGLTYAGLQYGGWCFGGNTLGYVQVSESECDMPCTADNSQICGGSWRNSIYKTETTSTPPVTSDTTAPTVTITSPADGSSVLRGDNVTITASVTDNVGVTRVEFYVDGSLKCTDSAASYTCTTKISGRRGANHLIEARAFDSAGNTARHQITVKTR
jgi:hypothetical protein